MHKIFKFPTNKTFYLNNFPKQDIFLKFNLYNVTNKINNPENLHITKSIFFNFTNSKNPNKNNPKIFYCKSTNFKTFENNFFNFNKITNFSFITKHSDESHKTIPESLNENFSLEENIIDNIHNNSQKNNKITIQSSINRKKNKKLSKKLAKKDYKIEGNFIRDLLLQSQILIFDNDNLNKKNYSEEQEKNNTNQQLFLLNENDQEKIIYNQIIYLLEKGDLHEALSKCLDIILYLENSDLKNRTIPNSNFKNILYTYNSIIFKKLYTYKLCRVDLYLNLNNHREGLNNLDALISYLESNLDKFSQDEYNILIKLREKLIFLLGELQPEKTKKLLNSNIQFLENKILEKNISSNQYYLTYIIMLVENIYKLAIFLKEEKLFKESIIFLNKIIKIKDSFPQIQNYILDIEYMLYLALGLNHFGLKEYTLSLNFYEIAYSFLKDEITENFIEAKILILDKICEIYENLENSEKLIEKLEEKKDLKILLIDTKIKTYKDYISETQKCGVEILDKTTFIPEIEVLDVNKTIELPEKTEFFENFERDNLKEEYLELAKIYEDILEIYLEKDNYNKLDEYTSQSMRYYEKHNENIVFRANLFFIIFLKLYDEKKYENCLEIILNLLKNLDDFEKDIIYLLNCNEMEEFKEDELEFFKFTESYFNLEDDEKKKFILNKFTSFDWYSFDVRFKIYCYISRIYSYLNKEEEKIKYQNLALEEFDDYPEKEQINLLCFIDVLKIYENRKSYEKLLGMYDLIMKRIRLGDLDFLKHKENVMYSQTIFEVVFCRVNCLISIERYKEAKDTIKMFNDMLLKDNSLNITIDDKENMDKTLNLLDLKLKYIK